MVRREASSWKVMMIEKQRNVRSYPAAAAAQYVGSGECKRRRLSCRERHLHRPLSAERWGPWRSYTTQYLSASFGDMARIEDTTKREEIT